MNDSRPLPPPSHAQNAENRLAGSLLLIVVAGATTFPGAALGAAISWLLWRETRPSNVTAWLLGGLGTATAVALRAAVVMGWPWRLLAFASGLTSSNGGVSLGTIAHSILVEALLGPLLLPLARLTAFHWARTVRGQELARYREMAKRKKALERDWEGVESARPMSPSGHPQATIRLGLEGQNREFDLSSEEIRHHIFLPGASGTGKTTTIARIADGALASGYGVVIIDCKGSGLGGAARMLAARHHAPLTVVDPSDEASAGYDPCTGSAAAVANKIVGAFTFSGEAEIYKQIAMEVIPVMCRAMTSSGIPVSLDTIYETLEKGGLSRLGRRDGADAYRMRLTQLDDAGGIAAAGYLGLQRRLGALMEGTFGELFRKRPALDWREQVNTRRVTYLSLSATAAGEDVELFGRLITQDLKQICDERMRAIDGGADPPPVLIVYDEFAALREATQIVDLLLQARQARAPLLVATQFLPEDVPIRRPLLSAGVLIVHRLEAEDAELVAKQFGTHTSPMLTAQVDYETGESEKGSVRWVEEFDIHPNELRSLPVGMAAVLARGSNRKALVRIYRTS